MRTANKKQLAESKRTRSTRKVRLRSEKIQASHLERLAVVYVRQSTPEQVQRHKESTQVQYDLQERALVLGWPKERVLVIDDDLGKSGTSSTDRPGFQRLVTEVTMDHVGIILGAEMSRIARSCRDWHHLLEVCKLYRTLIADLDGIYSPYEFNDKLLLGFKGAMSEAEIHIIRTRMRAGLLKKAERCELFMGVPTGYVKLPSCEVILDPDEQVQHVVRLIFRKFEELGTLNAVLDYLVRNRIQIGIRPRVGSSKGKLEWHSPNRSTIRNILKHPIYAGAYVFGRKCVDPKRKRAGHVGSGRLELDMADWEVLERDRLPAYITWEQYEANLDRFRANRSRSESRGSPRKGAALLTGLIFCGRCGCRMAPQYAGKDDYYQYFCRMRKTHYGDPVCQSLSGPPLDAHVESLALAVLTPANLEVSMHAATNIERERIEANQLWEQRLERAAYEADRARSQYDLCEPENRLVARQLEMAWEQKLAELNRLEHEYDRFQAEKPKRLSQTERMQIEQLAEDIPSLWRDDATTMQTKKAIMRELIESVTVEVLGNSEKVNVTIKWAGGHDTETMMIRPVARLQQLSNYTELVERIRSLAKEGRTAEEIAERLNAEGFRPPKRAKRYTRQAISHLMYRLGIEAKNAGWKKQDDLRGRLRPNEWTFQDLARELDMPTITLYCWKERGWIQTRTAYVRSRKRHIALVDLTELKRLRKLRSLPAGYHLRREWIDEPGEDLRKPITSSTGRN